MKQIEKITECIRKEKQTPSVSRRSILVVLTVSVICVIMIGLPEFCGAMFLNTYLHESAVSDINFWEDVLLVGEINSMIPIMYFLIPSTHYSHLNITCERLLQNMKAHGNAIESTIGRKIRHKKIL